MRWRAASRPSRARRPYKPRTAGPHVQRLEPIRIGLLGRGTIGTGVIKLLRNNREMLAHKLGVPLELAGVADKILTPEPSLGLTAALITPDPAALIARPDIDIVIELFGGHEPARSLLLKALESGKDVVSANKAMLAEHAEELFRAAERLGRSVGFEASVGGGVPIIRTLTQALAGDRQRAVHGIVNGTCNFILTTMSEREVEFDDALKQAQRDGLAEANPALDIEGHDAAHKLCLLVTLAFGAMLKPAQVYTEGIARVTQADIAYANELGYAIKLLAIAKDDDGRIEARVHPTMVPKRHPLAAVGGAYNAIYIHGEALGASMYFGLGAGQMPTATAVIADVMEIARERLAARQLVSNGRSVRRHGLGFPVASIKKARVKPMDDVVSEYYLRFKAADKPGVLGAIASVLGRSGISIASVIQQGREAERTVPIVMRTHQARERNLKRALAAIARRKLAGAAPAFIRIEENL
jgi:homoserine dehydrogenase